MVQVAVYGTLRKSEQRWGAMTEDEFCGQSTLPSEFALYNLGSFPCVSKVQEAVDNPVICEVFQISQDKLENTLDRIEGYPGFYNREQVDVEGYGACWVYTLKPNGAPQILSGDWRNRNEENF